MKRNLRFLPAQTLLLIIFGSVSLTTHAQPWTYDFGTGTGNFDTANKSSTTFFSTISAPTPAGGGSFRLRTSPAGTSGAGHIVANPGTSLGTGSELQINAPNSSVINKFTVFGWDNPAPVAYVKCKFRSTSSDTGVVAFTMGDGISLVYNGNDTYTAYASTMAAFTIAYKGGVLTTVARRNLTATTPVVNSGLNKDADQTIEVYANNASTATTYIKNGTNNLSSQTWDLWIDGIKLSPDGGWASARATNMSFIAADVPLAGFGFFTNLSHTNEAFAYIDDLEYSNSLTPSVLPLTLLSFKGILKQNTAQLDWETTNEVNVRGYSIEKSMGDDKYEEIGFVPAFNQSKNYYSFTDKNLKPGVNLYRTKMIDKDGLYSYSSIIKISGNQKSLLLSPNPLTHTTAIVSYPTAGSLAYLKILSLDGHTVKATKVSEGSVQTNISIANLLPGNYILVLEDNGEKTVTQFIKE